MSFTAGKLKELLAVIPDDVEVWMNHVTIGESCNKPILRFDYGNLPSASNLEKKYLSVKKNCQDLKRQDLEKDIKKAQETLDRSNKELEKLLQEDA